MRRFAGLALGLALGACASGSPTAGPPPPTPVASPSLAPGWTTLVDSQAGFSIAVPPAWEAALRDDPQRAATLSSISTRHPQAGAYITKQLAAVAAIIADPTPEQAYINSCAVLREDAGATATAPTLSTLAKQKLVQLRAATDLKQAPTLKAATLPAGPAFEIDYSITLPGSREAAVSVLLLSADRGGHRSLYELVLARLAADTDGPNLRTVARSFRHTA